MDELKVKDYTPEQAAEDIRAWHDFIERGPSKNLADIAFAAALCQVFKALWSAGYEDAATEMFETTRAYHTLLNQVEGKK